jgi:hypothetical protein
LSNLLDLLSRARGGPRPTVSGYVPGEIDAGEVWSRAVDVSRRALDRANDRPVISFDYGPVCIVHSADWHLGGEGTDYARLEAELGVVRDTPGMYLGFVGDALDNFIIGKLMSLRMNTRFKVSEEWAMVRHAFEMIATKLLYVVDGNHDQWTYRLGGIDYFRDVMESIRPGVVYGNDELLLDVRVGDGLTQIRARHKWKGSSIYNDTHGIERAAKFDKGVPFDIGVAAHTHASGLSREFNNGRSTGHAVLCGTYKRLDAFATQVGFTRPNEATAVATVIDESGVLLGTSNLMAAAAFMRALYKEDDEQPTTDHNTGTGAASA